MTNGGSIYDKEQGAFRLDTPCSSYVMALADGKWLGHVYYGPRLAVRSLDWAKDYWGLDQPPHSPDQYPKEAASFFDRFPTEYPTANTGDFRECCLSIQGSDCLPEFVSCEILPGKPKLEGLPATFGSADDCSTLKIVLRDTPTKTTLELYYTAFTGLDVLTRSVRIVNEGSGTVCIERALSACLDLPEAGYQMLTLSGSWARERAVQIRDIGRGFQGCASCRGIPLSRRSAPGLPKNGARCTPCTSSTPEIFWRRSGRISLTACGWSWASIRKISPGSWSRERRSRRRRRC